LSEDFIIVLDANMSGRIVVSELRSNGISVEILTDHFAADVKDTIWIPEVSRRGWVIITRDKSIRYNYLEKLVVKNSGARMFMLTTGNATAKEMAECIVKSMRAARRIVMKTRPPFIGKIDRQGRVKIWLDADDLSTQV
jgi:predicted nuclease of predicted toxin-antitoxin system